MPQRPQSNDTLGAVSTSGAQILISIIPIIEIELGLREETADSMATERKYKMNLEHHIMPESDARGKC